MKRNVRIDLNDLSKMERTPQGYLRAPAYATRIGVLKYRKSDGSLLRELRNPEEVFSKTSMDTLSGVPVTLEHPPKMLNASNTRQFMIGFTSHEVDKDENFLKTFVTITDSEAIDKIESGKHQLSCGYECELEFKQGVFDGEEYDAIQKNIVYNHLAVVDRGRAGPLVRLHLDSEDAFADGRYDTGSNNSHLDQDKGKVNMDKIMLGGKEFEVSPELKAAIEAQMSSAATVMEDGFKAKQVEMEGKASEAAKAKDEIQAKADSLTAEIETIKKERLDAESIEKLVAERTTARIRVLNAAQSVLDKEEKFDALSDLEIKKKVILAQAPKAELEGKTDAYIDARFDAAFEALETSGKILKTIGESKTPTDPKVVDTNKAETARKKSMDDAKDLWKQPLSVTKNKEEK